MTTQKSIRQELDRLYEKIRDLNDIPKHRPEIKELEKRISDIRIKYIESVKAELNELNAQATNLREQLFQLKNSRKPQLKLSKKVSEWFSRYYSGVETVGRPNIIWVSEDKKFVIIHEPGGAYWAGIGIRNYAPSKYVLEKVGTRRIDNLLGTNLMYFEGQLNKEKKQKLIDKAKELSNG